MEYKGYPTAEELHREKTEGANMPLALVYGLVAGAVGAAIWFGLVVVTNHEVGLVAILIGALVGGGVVLGSGNKHNVQLQVLAVALTVAAMAVAEYFIVRHFFIKYVAETYGAGSAASVPLFLPLDEAWDFVSGAIKDDPLTLVFWGVAVWTAFGIPAAPKVVPAPAAAPATGAPPAPPG